MTKRVYIFTNFHISSRKLYAYYIAIFIFTSSYIRSKEILLQSHVKKSQTFEGDSIFKSKTILEVPPENKFLGWAHGKSELVSTEKKWNNRGNKLLRRKLHNFIKNNFEGIFLLNDLILVYWNVLWLHCKQLLNYKNHLLNCNLKNIIVDLSSLNIINELIF